MNNNNNNEQQSKNSATKKVEQATNEKSNNKMATLEQFMSLGMSEELAKVALAAVEKGKAKCDAKEELAKEFETWKDTSGYNKAMVKVKKLEEKLVAAKKDLPKIPEKFAVKSKGAIGGVKITATWKGAGRSKHDAETLAKQNIKDAKWVLNSAKNIACPCGNGTDGTVETKFMKLFEHMKSVKGVIEGKDFSKELALVKPSTFTEGCRFMCRTKERMEKHVQDECKFQKVDGKYCKKAN